MPPTSTKAIILFPSVISNLLLEELDLFFFLRVGGTFIKRLKVLFLYHGIFLTDFSPLFSYLQASSTDACNGQIDNGTSNTTTDTLNSVSRGSL